MDYNFCQYRAPSPLGVAAASSDGGAATHPPSWIPSWQQQGQQQQQHNAKRRLIELPQQQQQHAAHVVDSDALLRLEREREGRCPTCGAQTHLLHYGSAALKEPLTIDKEVYRGRCLFCRPLSSGGLGTPSQHYGRYVRRLTPDDGHSLDISSISSASASVGLADCAVAAAGDPGPRWPQQQQQQQPLANFPSNHSSISSDAPPIRSVSQEQEENSPPRGVIRRQPPTDDASDHETDDDDIRDILARMRLRPRDLPTQTSALHDLWVLSWENENAASIGRLGGVPTILESLRYHLAAHRDVSGRYNRGNHTNSPSACRAMRLQSNGLATVQNLSSASGHNKELLAKGGGVPLILLSMSTFLPCAEIQRSGCYALANILGETGGGGGAVLLASGGLAVINRSLEAHRDNEGVVRGAYKCLRLLGRGPSWNELAGRWSDKGGETT